MVAARSGTMPVTPASERPRRVLVTGLAVGLVLVQWVLWTGNNGILEYAGLTRDVSDARARNERLAARNALLAEDVIDIKSRDEAIEELARNRLGMIRDGERFYHVVERP